MFIFHAVSTLVKKERNNFTIKNNGVKLKVKLIQIVLNYLVKM